jgi:GT2 family glycosyltransferase
VVVTAHRPNLHCALTDEAGLFEHRTAFLADAERWCYLAADAVFAPSDFIVADLARPECGVRPSHVQIVPHPYDVRDLAEAAPDPFAAPLVAELSAARFKTAEPVLFFGKLQVQKGPCELVASLNALAAEKLMPPLWLFGRDAVHSPTGQSTYDVLSRRYARLVAQGGASYFGAYSLAGLRDLCRLNPICLAPYRAESFSYAAVEIMLCGGLPLFSAAGGLGDWLPADVRDDMCVDFTRPTDLDHKLAALLALNGGQRRRLSARLRAAVLARTDPVRVLNLKLAAIAQTGLTSGTRRYPFVHGEALSFGSATPLDRAGLAAEAPQRGETLSIREAGAPTEEDQADLISVIIPYYEMQTYLEETLASVEAQSYPRIEVIIVDDGSPTAQARALLERVLHTPRRFRTRVIRKYNGGLADARNAGARLAKGEYLYFLDADDTLHPSALAAALAVLKRFDNVAYVGAGLKEFGAGDKAWLAWDIDSPYIGFHNLQICAFLIRAEAWLRHGVNDVGMDLGMEDYDSHVRMFAAGVRGVALPRLLFNYRIRPQSMARQFTPAVCAHLYRRIIHNSPDLYRRYGPELVGLFAENGHGAQAPSPTALSPAHAALLDPAPPRLDLLEQDLELQASRDRLSQALAGQVRSDDAAWSYVAARHLLALNLAPAYAAQLLRDAISAAPENGWYKVYGYIALLRLDRPSQAAGLRTDALLCFCRQEADAIHWIANLEGARGFSQVHHALLGLILRGDDRAEFQLARFRGLTPEHTPSHEFSSLGQAIKRLERTLSRQSAHRVAVLEAIFAVRAASAALISEEAFAALLARWLGVWIRSGAVTPEAWRAVAAALALSPELETVADGWISAAPLDFAKQPRKGPARLRRSVLNLVGAARLRTAAGPVKRRLTTRRALADPPS